MTCGTSLILPEEYFSLAGEHSRARDKPGGNISWLRKSFADQELVVWKPFVGSTGSIRHTVDSPAIR